ncbi:MAG: 6-carboxytetrahydropterin synthase [Armatimonadota bacterium]
MGRYRVCKSFTVESGHMLSKHAGMCRFPHGHTRVIEVVLSSETLDSNDMVVDFKAIKLLCKEHIERYDHRMALNSSDPLLPAMQNVHPDSVLVFDETDPTTEVIAREIFDFVASKLATGFEKDGYWIEPGRVLLERIRVTETPSSWAEYRI